MKRDVRKDFFPGLIALLILIAAYFLNWNLLRLGFFTYVFFLTLIMCLRISFSIVMNHQARKDKKPLPYPRFIDLL